MSAEIPLADILAGDRGLLRKARMQSFRRAGEYVLISEVPRPGFDDEVPRLAVQSSSPTHCGQTSINKEWGGI